MHGDTAQVRRPRQRRTVAAAALLCGAAVLTSGCTSSGTPAPAAKAAVDAADEAKVTSTAAIAFTFDSLSVDVAPTDPVGVTVTDGRLSAVGVTDEKGKALAGELATDGSSWTVTGQLRFSRRYTVTASAVDADGRVAGRTGSFTTLEPRRVLETSISPLDGQNVGVGMPVVVRFNEGVKDRAAVESALTVRSSKPIDGSWSWTSDEEVHFRPRTFWPAYSKVRVDVDLKGVHAGRGVWGKDNRRISFETGSRMVSVVDVDAHTLTVRRNGKKLRVIPVSTGKAGFLTRNGTKVILEKHTLKVMDAATIGIGQGDPEYYRLDVPYAMRVTWSGEFVHAAPWSVGSQGRDNVSHGCVGMAPSHAIWLFNMSTVGDVVRVKGSPRQLEPGNGYTDWNVSWADWVANSAL